MRIDNLSGLGEKRNFLQHLIPVMWVLPHDGGFVWRQGSRLEQNLVGDRDLSDVMQERSPGHRIDLLSWQAHCAGNTNGERGHALRMPFGPAFLEAKRIAQR